jgi:hypothetical protein
MYILPHYTFNKSSVAHHGPCLSRTSLDNGVLISFTLYLSCLGFRAKNCKKRSFTPRVECSSGAVPEEEAFEG